MMGRIIIPLNDDKESPWLIGLSEEGLNYLKNGWPEGINYNDSSKLFIKLKGN